MIIVIYRPIIGTVGDYQSLSAAREGTPPAPGLTMHTAYDMGEGKLGMTEIWESREAWENAMLDLLPILRQLRVDVGTPQVYDLYQYFSTSSGEAN